MAVTPDHITITVDEKALREQVQTVVTQAMREASWSLRRAADTLDPEFMPTHLKVVEASFRKQWEAERATVSGNTDTTKEESPK